MRTGRFNHACFSIAENETTSKVVAMGGIARRHSGWNSLTTAEILDITTMQWEDLPDLPFVVSGQKGVESITGPYLGFSLAGRKTNGKLRRSIIGLRKNQNGNYHWEELNDILTTGRELHAVVNVPDAMAPSC